MRCGLCEVDMHAHCKAPSPLYCNCRCRNFGPVEAPEVRRSQFGFSFRDDGQVVLLSEDDGNWFPVDSFSPGWLMDLSMAAKDAAARQLERK